MAFNIKDFKANLSKYGTLQNNRFDVHIPISNNLASITKLGNRDISELLTFRAQDAVLPGVKLETGDNLIYGYGPAQKMPFNVVFTDTSIKFLVDADGEIYNFFYNWINKIYKFDISNNNRPSFALSYKYDENGYPNYIADISINSYDTSGNVISTHKLNGAFPTYINEIPMSWEDNNNLVKLDVGFTYFTWSYIKNL